MKARALASAFLLFLFSTQANAESLHAFDGFVVIFMGVFTTGIVLLLCVLLAFRKPIWLHVVTMLALPALYVTALDRIWTYFTWKPAEGSLFWATMYFALASLASAALFIMYLRRPVSG